MKAPEDLSLKQKSDSLWKLTEKTGRNSRVSGRVATGSVLQKQDELLGFSSEHCERGLNSHHLLSLFKFSEFPGKNLIGQHS